MLGNLFEEEKGAFETLETALFGSVKGGAPRTPRSQCKLAGIANQGATCYLNSLLQTLLLTPEFRESLFQLSETDLGRLEDKDKPGAKVRVIPLQLQRLFARLLLLDQQSVSTADLTESFGWTNNEQFQQHDVQELNRILFCAIEDSLVGTSGQSLIQRLYHGNIVNQIICKECGKISERREDFLDLTLSVSGMDSLETALNSFYCTMEMMDGKNQYRCEQCQKLVDAEKGAKIRNLPQILTISLLRFSYDFQKMQRYKETGKFTFPMELDMKPYVEKTSESDDDLQYELFSVVIHRGGAYGGHYHAYIRDIDNLGHWVHPGKVDVEIVGKRQTGAVELIKTNSPAELIEIILLKNPNQAMPVDQLGSEISKQTGVTWNKRYKKNHGTLSKYLSKQRGQIRYNPDTRWVMLASSEPQSTDSTTTGTDSSSVSLFPDTGSGSSVTEEGVVTDPAVADVSGPWPPSDVPPVGYQWFNFDDSRVSPITVTEIERHFSGRESAYMLFYRRKQKSRTPEADGNPGYQIPDNILADILLENDNLAKERQEYDAKVNTINVQLHFEPHYHYKEGALKMCHPSGKFSELTIDRRKSVADLLVSVREVGGNLVPEKLTLHRMRDLPAGYHLYDCVSDEPEKLISSLNIDNNAKLFVWDGELVGGGSIPTGPECEPIYLTIVYGNPSKFSCGFSKDISFAAFKSSVCALTGIQESDLTLKKMVGSDLSPAFLSLNDEDVSLPLAVLNFQDGDSVVAEDKTIQNGAVTHMAASKEIQFTVFVENRCVQTECRWTRQIQVTKDMTVGELKVLAVSSFKEDGLLDGGRLRVDHPTIGLRPPLHEQQTVYEAGLLGDVCLVLEPGKAPETNQITLTFTPHDPQNDLPDIEITVEKADTVRDCLRKMLEQAGFTGDDWHLRKTNWCGEMAEVLDDLDLTLGKNLVSDGDHLLLLSGRLPPKGYLRLPIHLYPTPSNPRSASDQPGMLAWISAGIQGLLSPSASTTSADMAVPQPLQVGEIEISKDATLEDLKLQIMTLPAMTDMPVPTFEFLRVRLVSDHRPGQVLRGLTQTLRRLKVTSGSSIAVQIVPHEENLSSNEIIINIKQRLPGTKTYDMEQELIWDVSHGVTPLDFLQAVADFLALPVEQIRVAKHITRQFKWLVVEEQKSPNQKGKKKKGGANKNSMRQAPYHVQDGDVFGVKTLQADPDNTDDFSTEEDILGREEIQRAADEKRKMREERKKAYGEGPATRRPEVALTIKVDSFT
ncbi:ubiquitin carboxyl-terminal hydrolase 40-like [Haliotis rubra]|uniref:ubiquitin carboxyl-terminal hydrolase 40-like n=1 Tax=Haliotis rubra TaxID=36100 RepID=UPI001EE6194C|nr:ubiquitin carboxyl-terminal hydrolase 40-like [Haliotis rubra]